MANKKSLLSLMLAALLLLCSCARHIPVSVPDGSKTPSQALEDNNGHKDSVPDSENPPPGSIEPDSENPPPDKKEPDSPHGEEGPSYEAHPAADGDNGDEKNTPPEAESPASQTPEPPDKPQPDTEPLEDISGFSMPEEFFLRLDELLSGYLVNPHCEPDKTPCGCQPELAVDNGDGTVTKDRIVSIYFEDLETKYSFEINPGVHYPVASTVKMPFITLAYQMLEDGRLSPDTVLTYERRHYFGGTGVIVQGDFGQQYTVAQLLTLAITRSDNVAYEMLKDVVSMDEMFDSLRQRGVSHPEDLRKSKQKICLQSAEAYSHILNDYIASDGEYVSLYRQDLLNTRLRLICSSYPVLRKYGWTGFSLHDIAIVEAPHPYILIILTNLDEGTKQDIGLFESISLLVEEYSQSRGEG